MVFSAKAKQEFNIEAVVSPKTEAFINECIRAYQGTPDWLDENVTTVNFAESVCSEVARLTTLAIGITVDGSARADYLQAKIDSVFFRLRDWVEYGMGYGTIILKPTIDDIQVMTPERFMITDVTNGQINGIVFHDQIQSADGKKWYNKLEYHRFLDNGNYAIDNRCYVGDTVNDAGKPLNIEDSPWRGLLDSAELKNVETPLFGVLKTPQANNKEVESALGLPIFAKAIEELKDLDIAYSRNAGEIADSEKIVLMDSDKLMVNGKANVRNYEQTRKTMKLPHYIRTVEGNGSDDFYQEINPQLNTPVRLEGINYLLSQIGFKCGFSNGYFVFNEKTGMVTATQVEADDRRTIQFIKDCRDRLESALDGLIYALTVFADLYSLAPVGAYEVTYDFGDITYNAEEDRQRWWNYVQSGKVPAWKYFVKFEGMSEDEAKEMLAEATNTSTIYEEE